VENVKYGCFEVYLLIRYSVPTALKSSKLPESQLSST